jgi:transposase
MDAMGVPRAEIARRLGLSRNTVAKYAEIKDMSPVPPVAGRRARPSIDAYAAWIASVLEADLGAPRKQRHTAKRIYDRLVAERGYEGSYSSVRRFVAEWRREHGQGGLGSLELEWRPGSAQVDFGNFECDIAGERVAAKLLVAALPHSNARFCVAVRSERAECMCWGLREIFERIGRAPHTLVLDNATEAGRMLRGKVTESELFSQFRAH